MDDFYDPVYRGAASPATVLGIPMVPFILATVVFAQLGILGMALWGLAGVAPVAITYFALFRWARVVGRHDEQRVLQLLIRSRMRLRQGGTRAIWGAVSYAPGRASGRR